MRKKSTAPVKGRQYYLRNHIMASCITNRFFDEIDHAYYWIDEKADCLRGRMNGSNFIVCNNGERDEYGRSELFDLAVPITFKYSRGKYWIILPPRKPGIPRMQVHGFVGERCIWKW